MIINFKIKNFKSFNDTTIISLANGRADKFNDRVVKFKDYTLAKFGVFFGGNNCGKSNLIDALSYMRQVVLNKQFLLPIDYSYNGPNYKKGMPSLFEVNITYENKTYGYGFEIDTFSKSIISEWLVKSEGTKKPRTLFRRNLVLGSLEFKMNLNRDLKDKVKKYASGIVHDSDSLLLKVIYDNYDESFKKYCTPSDIQLYGCLNTYKWFTNIKHFSSDDGVIVSGTYEEMTSMIGDIEHILVNCDTKLSGTTILDQSTKLMNRLAISSILEQLTRERITFPNKFSMNNSSQFKFHMVRSLGDIYIIGCDENFRYIIKKLMFTDYFDNNISYRYNDLTYGTKKLFDNLLMSCCKSSEGLFLYDDIDTGLHTILVQAYMKNLLKNSANSNTQYIITSNDEKLMKESILRQAEVWFISNDNGTSNIYSLETFRKRSSRPADKDYLDGVFGSIPTIKI